MCLSDWSSDVCSSDLFEVLLDIFGSRQPAVRAHAKAEMRFGRRHFGRQLARRKWKGDRRQEDDDGKEIGRASCREAVQGWGGDVSVRRQVGMPGCGAT